MSSDEQSDYKITALIDEQFDDLTINLVDFKRHLRAEIVLDKTLTRGLDGRPVQKDYFYSGTQYAKLIYTFVTNADNFVIERTESIYYIKNDDTDGIEVKISHRTYDPTNLGDVALMMQERTQARSFIIEEIKAFTAGVLQQAPMTIPQIIALTIGFWNDHSGLMNEFIGLGYEGFKDAIAAIDTTVDYTWLGTVWNVDGDTLQDYFVSRLSY